jgi:hypothetical protein
MSAIMFVPAAVTESANFLIVKVLFNMSKISYDLCMLHTYLVIRVAYCVPIGFFMWWLYQFGDLWWHVELIYRVLIEVVSSLLRTLEGQYSDAVPYCVLVSLLYPKSMGLYVL